MMFYKETDFKEEPAIGNIPKEWKVARLKDVADYLNGYPFSPEDWKDKGLPIIRIQNLNDPAAEFNYFQGDIEDRYVVENGDLLFSWSASIGAYIWNRGKAVLNQHIFKVVPNDNVDKLYLYYALFLAIEQLKRKVHGSTMKHFKKTELQTKIPVPSLSEQKAIVGVLGVVDSAVELVDRVIAKTERLKKGLMQTLLTRGIGHKEFKDTEIGRIPKDWEVVKFGSITTLIKGKKPPKISEEYRAGYLPYLSTEYLRNNEKPKFAEVSHDVVLVDDRDLVLLWDGSNAGEFFLGKKGILSSTMVKITLTRDDISRLFFFYLLKTREKYLSELTRGTGIPHVDKSVVNNLLFAIPNSLEQQRIAEILLTVDKKLELERSEKAILERIKQGMMDLLLTGKIRVKVD